MCTKECFLRHFVRLRSECPPQAVTTLFFPLCTAVKYTCPTFCLKIGKVSQEKIEVIHVMLLQYY